jgi:hypothetical protein
VTHLSDSVGTSARTLALDFPARRRFNPLTMRLPWWGEAFVAVAFYLLYDAVQSLTQSAASTGAAHGLDIIHAERVLHIWAEPDVNRWATGHHWISLIAGYDYSVAHVAVTGAVLAYLWWRHPRVEVTLRNAIVGMSLAALVVYWLFPVSSPRFVVPGLADTLIRNDILGARHSYNGFVNLYAAMPSLHVAWAIWSAAAIVIALRSRWRLLAWLYPCWTTFVVVATANHYFLDAAAGAALAAAALAPVLIRRRPLPVE